MVGCCWRPSVPAGKGWFDVAAITLDLAHSYKRDPQVEADFALLPMKMSFRDGGAYALLGPSGCGKTTLLNIMSGLLVPSRGTVQFDGRDVTHTTPQQVACNCGAARGLRWPCPQPRLAR